MTFPVIICYYFSNIFYLFLNFFNLIKKIMYNNKKFIQLIIAGRENKIPD